MSGLPSISSAAELSLEMQSPNMLEAIQAATLRDDYLSAQQEHVQVSACGRTVSVAAKDVTSFVDLQQSLQKVFAMENQDFQVFDVNGDSLVTDAQVIEAVARGQTPLCATLSDASIHYIENRREELAQMQWKLVRDQITGNTGKLAAMARQVQELEKMLENHKHETYQLIEQSTHEQYRALETERDTTQTEARQLAERINAVSQLVSGERNNRESALAGLEKALQGVRDMCDNERKGHMDRNAQLSAEWSTRLDDFDVRFLTLENHVADAAARQTSTLERLGERSEKIAQGLDLVRFDVSQIGSKDELITELYDKIKTVEMAIDSRDEEARNFLAEEKARRVEQKQVEVTMQQEQRRQLTELEIKLADRLERESASREENARDMMLEVTRRTAKKSEEQGSLGPDGASSLGDPCASPSRALIMEKACLQGEGVAAQAAAAASMALMTTHQVVAVGSVPASLKAPPGPNRYNVHATTPTHSSVGSFMAPVGTAQLSPRSLTSTPSLKVIQGVKTPSSASTPGGSVTVAMLGTQPVQPVADGRLSPGRWVKAPPMRNGVHPLKRSRSGPPGGSLTRGRAATMA